MNRFLIRPGVHCANLASHVLGLCARRVGPDFQRRYGLRPWLLESFVETQTYEGSCYKAANWIQVGQGVGATGAIRPARASRTSTFMRWSIISRVEWECSHPRWWL